MKISLTNYLCVSSLIFQTCQEPVILMENNSENYSVKKYGSENSFDVVTWNLEHFPKNEQKTVHYLNKIISAIDTDLIAVQEIDDRESFIQLIDSLQGYDGYVSYLPSYGQRLGFIYKSAMISISKPQQIFTNDNWAFPRPPLVTSVTVRKENDVNIDFIIINLHLKAFLDDESKSRRKAACNILKDYIDTYLLSGPEKDVIILGDFNDELSDPEDENIFNRFLIDSVKYQILSLPLAGEATFIGDFQNAIDHIIITDTMRDEFSGGDVKVLNIDEDFNEYLFSISDHRPVLVRFFIF